MLKKIAIPLLLLTLFLNVITSQTTLAAPKEDTNYEQTLNSSTTEEDYSIQSRQLPEKKGLDFGSLVRMKPSQASRFVKSNGTDEHQFKADYVGKTRVSQFDIAYSKTNHAVYLLNKAGNVYIETGYYFVMP